MSRDNSTSREPSVVEQSVRWLRDAVRVPDPPASDQSTPEQPLAPDMVYDLLAIPRRRYLLDVLADARSFVPVTDLIDLVASVEYDRPVDELSDTHRSRVRAALHQHHLPRLADADVVDWDTETATVTRGPAFDHIRTAQQAIRDAAAS